MLLLCQLSQGETVRERPRGAARHPPADVVAAARRAAQRRAWSTPAARARTSSTASPTRRCSKSSLSSTVSIAPRSKPCPSTGTHFTPGRAGRRRAHRHRRGDVRAAQRAHRRHQRHRSAACCSPRAATSPGASPSSSAWSARRCVYCAVRVALAAAASTPATARSCWPGCWWASARATARGCTSGHGVCGLSRLSPRSLVATAAFMGAGFVTVFVTRHLLGI